MLDGDWKILAVIWHTPISIGDQIFSITKKKACHMFMETFHYKEGCLKKNICRKIDDWKLLIATGLKIFNRKIDDRNLFSITICNEGCPSVNNYFLWHPNRFDEHDKTCQIDANLTPNTKWSGHVNFDNLDLNLNSCPLTYQYVLHIISKIFVNMYF